MNESERKQKEIADRKRYADNTLRLTEIINPLRRSAYTCDVDWRHIACSLEHYREDFGGLELCPDFQRGHVWTEAQQIHYLENALRGVVAQTAFVIQFNCPNWESDKYSGDLPHGFQCIDGLQRLTAVQRFMNDEIRPFGFSVEDLNFSGFSIHSSYRFRLEVFDFQKKADLLQHYLDLNSGGTPHSKEEIERVKTMLKEVQQ